MKVRESAAIAQKSRITKARKVLKKWADEGTHIELLTLRGSLRVKGGIRQLSDDPKGDDFMFVSDSREVTSMIFLESWKEIIVQRGGPQDVVVHVRSEVDGEHGITLMQEYVSASKENEMSSLLKQMSLWIRLRSKLFIGFQSAFTSVYWIGTIEEHSPGVFALHNKDANQKHLLHTVQCDHVKVEESKANTIVTLSSRTGHFLVVLSDSPSNLEAAIKLLVLKETTVH